jgi:Effector Associated Constant Component 1
MADQIAQLTLTVDASHDADEQERAELTRHLRRYLIDRDFEKVELARSGVAPAGAKGDPAMLSALVVSMAPIALTALLGMLQSWLTRHERATVTVESGGEKLTLTGTLSPAQQQTVTAFLNRQKS